VESSPRNILKKKRQQQPPLSEEWDWDVSSVIINTKQEEKHTTSNSPSPVSGFKSKKQQDETNVGNGITELFSPPGEVDEEKGGETRSRGGTNATLSTVNYLLTRWERTQFRPVKDEYQRYQAYMKKFQEEKRKKVDRIYTVSNLKDSMIRQRGNSYRQVVDTNMRV